MSTAAVAIYTLSALSAEPGTLSTTEVLLQESTAFGVSDEQTESVDLVTPEAAAPETIGADSEMEWSLALSTEAPSENFSSEAIVLDQSLSESMAGVTQMPSLSPSIVPPERAAQEWEARSQVQPVQASSVGEQQLTSPQIASTQQKTQQDFGTAAIDLGTQRVDIAEVNPLDAGSLETDGTEEATPIALAASPLSLPHTDAVENGTSASSPLEISQRVTFNTFTDIEGHWAQPFIEVLAAEGIVSGFPDNTFRPDELMTRAQYAALVDQAFPDMRSEAPVDFVDVSGHFWAANSIQSAYESGFFEPVTDRRFRPDGTLPRSELLNTIATALDLSVVGSVADLNVYFQDATQIPVFDRLGVLAATEGALVVNYPEVRSLRPLRSATRAEAVATVYQALVNRGMFPPITGWVQPYIAGQIAPAPPPPEPDPEILRDRFRLPDIPNGALASNPVRIPPGTSINTPTADGADWRDVFFGLTYQERVRFSESPNGAFALGFGVGDAENAVGLETVVTVLNVLEENALLDGSISFKLHRQLPGNFAIAAGVEHAVQFGSTDIDTNVYGVVTKLFTLRDDPTAPFSSITASLGLGNGRFLPEGIDDGVNVFGSIGVRLAEPVGLIADWTGQNLNLGLSIVPFEDVPLVITPAIADLTDSAGDGPRFIVGAGVGFQF